MGHKDCVAAATEKSLLFSLMAGILNRVLAMKR